MDRLTILRDLDNLLPSRDGMMALADDFDCESSRQLIVRSLTKRYGKRTGILVAKAILAFRKDNPQYFTLGGS